MGGRESLQWRTQQKQPPATLVTSPIPRPQLRVRKRFFPYFVLLSQWKITLLPCKIQKRAKPSVKTHTFEWVIFMNNHKMHVKNCSLHYLPNDHFFICSFLISAAKKVSSDLPQENERWRGIPCKAFCWSRLLSDSKYGYSHGLYGIVRCHAREIRLILCFLQRFFREFFWNVRTKRRRVLCRTYIKVTT